MITKLLKIKPQLPNCLREKKNDRQTNFGFVKGGKIGGPHKFHKKSK